ncbi:MAG TPA: ABC transporter permease [Methanomassiliicoccales archaeon]|nr:ABC transporter permease [Methanomassiliicoccales archaeon]
MAKAKPTQTEESKGALDSIKRSLRPRIREWRFSLYLMRKSLLALVGIAIVLSIIIIAIFAPVFAPVPPTPPGRDPMIIPQDFQTPVPPGAPKPADIGGGTFLFGSGPLGTDIYYGVIWGSRTSIYISLYVVALAVVVGLVLGAIAGYYGGIVDEALMRITDIFLSVPALILAMAVVAVLTRSLENIMLALTLVWWPPYARIVRGQVLTIKENTYVEAARAVGAKRMRILFRHIVPNSLSPVLVNATMDIGVVVLVAAGLSFIGFGPPTGYAEWGKMVSDGQTYFLSIVNYNGQQLNPWWIWAFPGLFIFLFVMGFNLLGDGLRDILDPRLRR